MNEIEQKEIESFKESFLGGWASMSVGCCTYVASIDKNPAMRKCFANELGDIIPRNAWAMIESVGRKTCHPKLLMGGFVGKSSLIKRLPYSLQEQVINGERFELLTGTGEVLLVSVHDATDEQVKQLLGPGKIRTLPEQKAWLVEQKQTAAPDFNPEPVSYRITGGKLLVRRDTEFSKRELTRILQEM